MRMKHFALVAGLAIALSTGLSGCQTFQDAVSWATSTTTTPQEANTVAGAANLYNAVIPTADAFVKSSSCDYSCRSKVASISAALRKDLDDALDAEKAGNSAKVTVAIDAFNQVYPQLTAIVGAPKASTQ